MINTPIFVLKAQYAGQATMIRAYTSKSLAYAQLEILKSYGKEPELTLGPHISEDETSYMIYEKQQWVDNHLERNHAFASYFLIKETELIVSPDP